MIKGRIACCLAYFRSACLKGVNFFVVKKNKNLPIFKNLFDREEIRKNGINSEGQHKKLTIEATLETSKLAEKH